MGANGHTLPTPDRDPDDLADDGAAGIDEVEPPPGLRDRIMAAALAARPPGQTVDSTDRGGDSDLSSPVEVHRGEQQRALLFLRGLGADDWGYPVDPPEFARWTVHDVAAHLAANATLLADNLGVPVPGVPETSGDNDARTVAAQARHRALPPPVALAEIDAAARAVDAAVTGLDDDGLDELIDWWGAPTSIRWALTVRAFETWTHTDDIRRALGRPMRPPPRASLRTMSRAACALMPLMLAARGEHRAGRVVRVRFTDVADAAWDVDLGEAGEARPAGVAPVDAELSLDAVDLCRAVGARMPAGGLTYTSTGDADLARSVVDAIPALAVL
jgi:uncharacterized protein (TIGR03083 family)